MELPESKDLFQAVFDSASNGIAVMQSIYNDKGKVEDFSVLLFNPYAISWIGNREYKGKRYSEVFPNTKETGILDKFISVAETGKPVVFEYGYYEAPQDHWFRIRAVKQNGLLVATFDDITESKQAEIALNEALVTAAKQERLYHSITNNTPDLVYVFARDYTFDYANKALLTMWGKSAEDAIGKGLRDNGYEEWHAQMHEREIDDVIANKRSIRGTVSFPHAELGSRVYDYILVPVLNASGDVEVIAGTTRDITESTLAQSKLEQSEVRLKSMIDQTPVPTLVLMGDDLVVEQVNKPMLQLIGRGEEIIGVPLLQTLPELKGQYVWDQVMKVYDEGVSFDQSEVLVPHNRTGVIKDYYYNLAYRPLKENGRITGMIQVAIDVTEQVYARKKLEESEKTLEQQVNDRTKELNRSNQDLQQFAHVASHDLKEPVRKIEIFTNRLEQHLEGQLDETAKGFVNRIHVAIQRMSTMIDGVLSYSTTNAGIQQTEVVDLNSIISDIAIDLEIALQKKNGSIKFGELPKVEGAPVLVYQLFYNLINNSIKFARVDVPLEIEISSESGSDQDESQVHIYVKDNGIGFESKHTGAIFETFTRLNSKDQYEGTGLGLALCKKIVERHGGSVVAQGRPEEGATFIINLPVHQKVMAI